MVIKTIRFEFYEDWGKGFRTFNGWVYYMVNGSEYQVYEIYGPGTEHRLLAHFTKSNVKEIRETFV
jgi:hypothetical protein